MNFVKGLDNRLLYTTYVQKSKLFLLPLSGIRRDPVYRPTETYISTADIVSPSYPYGISLNDYILIITFSKKFRDMDTKIKIKERKVKYNQEVSRTWEYFEMEYILNNPLYLHTHETEDEYIYTLDLSDWKFDWDSFLKGRYSQLSQTAKDRILRYYWNDLSNNDRNRMQCYLFPYKQECLEAFADELQMSLDDLREVKELCSKPNMKSETFNCELLLNREVAHESEPEPTE